MATRINVTGEYMRRTTNLPVSTAFTLCGWANLTRRASAFQYWGLEDGATFEIIGYPDTVAPFEIYQGGSTSFASSPADGVWFFYAITGQGTGATDFKGYWALPTDTAFKTAQRTGASFTPTGLYLGSDSFDEFVNGLFAWTKVYGAALIEA